MPSRSDRTAALPTSPTNSSHSAAAWRGCGPPAAPLARRLPNVAASSMFSATVRERATVGCWNVRASPSRSRDAEYLTRDDLERDIRHGAQAAEVLANIDRPQHRRRCYFFNHGG